MRTFGVTTVTPPGIDPVTLDAVKLYARVDGSTEDALITTLITTATQLAEQFTARAFITRTLRHTLDAFTSLTRGDNQAARELLLPQPPLQTVTSIKYYDLSNAVHTVPAAAYGVNSDGFVGSVYLNSGYSWPAPLRARAAVEITYEAGYGPQATDVPAGITQAVTRLAALLYQRECSDCVSDATVTALLQPYRVRVW